MGWNDGYDEATLSNEDEESILSEKYRTILITKTESAPFLLMYLALSIQAHTFYWILIPPPLPILVPVPFLILIPVPILILIQINSEHLNYRLMTMLSRH